MWFCMLIFILMSWPVHTHQQYARLGTVHHLYQSATLLHGNDAYGISKRERYRRYRATTLCIILLCNNLIQLGDT